jgi:hypothetical protein
MKQVFIDHFFAVANHIPGNQVQEVRKKIQDPKG